MADPKSPEQSTGRDNLGKFAAGNRLGNQWGPDNPPPKSPGRPKKASSIIAALEAELGRGWHEDEDGFGKDAKAVAKRITELLKHGDEKHMASLFGILARYTEQQPEKKHSVEHRMVDEAIELVDGDGKRDN